MAHVVEVLLEVRPEIEPIRTRNGPRGRGVELRDVLRHG